MKTERAVGQLVSQCVSILARYHLLEKTWPNWASMVVEIRAVSAEAEKSGVSCDSIPSLLLIDLSERYDRETTERLIGEFTEILAVMPGRTNHCLSIYRE